MYETSKYLHNIKGLEYDPYQPSTDTSCGA
jgi:hypothetical protein